MDKSGSSGGRTLLCISVAVQIASVVMSNPSTVLESHEVMKEESRESHNSHTTISRTSPYKNRHPVIGILAQESDSSTGDSYIYEAYVKFIEQSGALVVPIRVDEPDEYYVNLFKKLNGVVFPGGGVSLLTSGYAKSAEHFFNLSKQAFDKGDIFPVLGICLGFEELTVLTASSNPLIKCDGVDFAVPMNFTHDAKNSRLFIDMPAYLFEALGKWNLTYNNHQYCMSTKVFRENRRLSKFYKVLSTNVAQDGTEFVSTMEAYKYPFYGVQWHPAKNIYLWSDARVNHSYLAVQAAQYISNFFVNQARNSTHHFDSLDDLADAVISNYNPVFDGAPSFHSLYHFTISKVAAEEFFVWDWPRFNKLTDLGMSQTLNFLLFLLMLLMLLGLLSSLMRQTPLLAYRRLHPETEHKLHQ